jgi:hypothetical protein
MRRSLWIPMAAFVCISASGISSLAEDGTTTAVTSIGAGAITSKPVYEPVPIPPLPDNKIRFRTKFTYYLRSTVSPRNFLEAGLIAGIPNLPSAPVQPAEPAVLNFETGKAYEDAMDAYGNGMDTWRRTSEVELRDRGRRFAVGMATAETRDFLSNFLLPVALREDPRYLPADIDQNFGNRVGHAFASIVVTHTDGGRLTPNLSKWAGTVGAALVAKQFYSSEFNAPRLSTNQFVARYVGFSLAGDLATNVGRELVRSIQRTDIQRLRDYGSPTEEHYYSLSAGGKFLYWAHSTYAPRNFAQGILFAGYPNVPDQPEYPATPNITTEQEELAFDQVLTNYGRTVQSWRENMENDVRYHERRLIGGVSESETQEFLTKFLLPTAFRMEPRYISSGPGTGFGKRLGNAFSSVVITRTNSGRHMINLPLLIGTPGAALIAQQVYYPQLGLTRLEQNSVMGKTIGFNFAGDVLINLMSELFSRRSY